MTATPESTATRPDWPWFHGWNVIAVMVALQALTIGLFFYSFSFWIQSWIDEFGISRATALTAATTYSVMMGAASLLAGRLLDAFPPRLLVIGGIVAMITGFTVVSFATAFWQIILVHATLFPLAACFAGPIAAQTLTIRWFLHKRGFALGISALGTSIGGLTLPLAVTLLAEQYGWRSGHQILATGCIVMLPLAWWVLGRTPPKEAEDLHTPDQPSGSFRETLRDPTFWVVIAMFVPGYFMLPAFQYNVAAIGADAGFSAQQSALLVSTMAFTMIIGKVIFGTLLDRFAPRTVYTFFAVGLACCFWLVPQLTGSLLTGLVATFGFFVGGIMPIQGAVVSAWFGAARFGRTMGMATPILMTSAIAPLFTGWAQEMSGGWLLPFSVLALMTVPSLIVLFRARVPTGERSQ